MDKIRILIIDDHPVVREGLAGMLAGQPDFVVVGEAKDGAEAVALAADFVPHPRSSPALKHVLFRPAVAINTVKTGVSNVPFRH